MPKMHRVLAWGYRDGAVLPDGFVCEAPTLGEATLMAVTALAESLGIEVCWGAGAPPGAPQDWHAVDRGGGVIEK